MYFTLDSEVNEDPPEFTLTCQSRGGPVTEVEWTRNGVRVEEDSNHMTSQIIVDTSVNTVYNNTLRVRGRDPGVYKCDVRSNYQYFFPDTNPGWSMATSTLVVRGKPFVTFSSPLICTKTTCVLFHYWHILQSPPLCSFLVLFWKMCVCSYVHHMHNYHLPSVYGKKLYFAWPRIL